MLAFGPHHRQTDGQSQGLSGHKPIEDISREAFRMQFILGLQEYI